MGFHTVSLLLECEENNYASELKNCFKELMTCKPEHVALQTNNILLRFIQQGSGF